MRVPHTLEERQRKHSVSNSHSSVQHTWPY